MYSLKVKLYAIITAIGVFLLGMIKFLSVRNKSLKKQNKQLEADVAFQNEVNESEAELRQEFSHRADEAKRDIENGEIPSHLRKPRQ